MPILVGERSYVEAFRACYQEHYGFVWAIIRRFGVDGSAADDAVQDAFVIAYRRFPEFHGGSAKPWLYGIARRVASNYRRGSARRKRRGQAIEGGSDLGERNPRLDAVLTIERFLESLSEADRELFVLSEVEGMTGPELSEMLQLKPNTAYSKVRRLRKRFEVTFGDGIPGLGDDREDRAIATKQSWAALLPLLDAPAKATWFATVAGHAVALGLAGAVAAGTTGVIVARMNGDLPLEAANVPRRDHEVRVPTPHSQPVATSIDEATSRSQPARASVERPSGWVGAGTLSAKEPSTVPGPVLRPESTIPKPEAPTSVVSQGERATALIEQNARLRAAVAALAGGEAERALQLTGSFDEHPVEAVLAGAWIAVRIEALCALDRHDEGRKLAREFMTHHPAAVVLPRIERSCAWAGTTSMPSGQSKQ